MRNNSRTGPVPIWEIYPAIYCSSFHDLNSANTIRLWSCTAMKAVGSLQWIGRFFLYGSHSVCLRFIDWHARQHVSTTARNSGVHLIPHIEVWVRILRRAHHRDKYLSMQEMLAVQWVENGMCFVPWADLSRIIKMFWRLCKHFMSLLKLRQLSLRRKQKLLLYWLRLLWHSGSKTDRASSKRFFIV